MNPQAATLLIALASGLSLLMHFCLSVALASASSLSRVALQRIGNEYGDRFGFVQELDEPTSPYLLAASLLRQASLLTTALFGGVLAARLESTLSWPWVVALVALVAALLTEHVLARAIAEWKPRPALWATGWVVRLARVVTYPIVLPLGAWLRWCGTNGQSDESREEEQDEEVEALIEVGEREGLLEAEESRMVRGIVDLDETVVRELMTPRTEIVGLDRTTTVRDARRLFLEAGHSRLPVFNGTIDDVVGLLHSRDLFRAWDAGDEDLSIEDYSRPAAFVPESMSAAELLSEMRQRTHMALVVDEYGGVAGLVTLEDLLEEIVGEIRDEHEEEELSIREEGDGSWIVNAVVHVKEIEQLFEIEFEDRDFDTVGGMVVSAFGRVPSVGDRVQTNGVAVEVLEADRTRVQRVRVMAADTPPEENS